MPGGSQPTDAELVIAAAGGDRAAFDQLVGRHQRRATSVAYRLLSNIDDAMEVTQESFFRAYEKLASLSAPERFGAWLLRIVSHQALNRRRGRALRRMASLDGFSVPAPGASDDGAGELNLPDGSAVSPAEEVSARELKESIRRAIDELPDKQRTALVLFSIEKLPQKEVAEILGMSVEAVKWNVFTARKTLKEQFRDYL